MIKISKMADRLYVRTPYHPQFIEYAHNLHGCWEAKQKVWCFSSRDEERIRQICHEIFGTDGDDEPLLVTVRVDLDAIKVDGDELYLCGRQVLRKLYRNLPPLLGEDVIVYKGSLKKHGGSRGYPKITWEPGTWLEIRNVPLTLAQKLIGTPGYIVIEEE